VAEAPSTIAALAKEEEKVIAGRAEGRAIAAKERASRDSDGSKPVDAIVDAYKAFLHNGGPGVRYTTLDQWLGSIDLDDFQ
jgi:hypothetical protein